ncbi:MAG: hypothetical protein A2900_03250 [Candidatus Chisholmbacteria bacterium RIFCSPLOWO2_01_FULL_50_28]|nr:MAG: hypothetical protein A2900_03250 [Candidatus Chisholmbacteria bacterium RIFCSPLOWO2_01_FULL_50_28]
MKKRMLVFIVLLFVASYPALRALMIPEFYTSHDGETHTARIANYYLALKEGQIPPRLAPTLFGNLGFPIFLFIYPLPYLLGAMFHSLGFSFTDAFEIVIGSSFLLSAITMFLFARKVFGEFPGFIAALFYTWAPYRFSQIYVRGAIAESFAYIFVPLVLLSLYNIAATQNHRWVGIGSLSLAGLLLSHQVVAFIFLPIFLGFFLLWLVKAEHKRTAVLKATGMALLGVMIGAFIYAPSLFELKYLRFDELIDYYNDHFVTVGQLIHSPWSYGFSMPGTNDDMSFQVGLTHLLVAALATISLGLFLFRTKKAAVRFPLFAMGSLSLAITALSVGFILELPAVHWLWKHLPFLDIIDFPWRLLGVTVFGTSLLAAYLVASAGRKVILSAVLLFFVFYANRNHVRINQTMVRNDAFFLSYQDTATWRNEFLSKWRQTNRWQHLEKDFRIRRGELKVKLIDGKTTSLSFLVEATDQGILDIHRLYFPGWTVFLDGKPLEIGKGLEITQDVQTETKESPFTDHSGLLSVNVPPGKHFIEARFTETPVRKVGFILSLIGMGYALAYILPKRSLVTASKTTKPVGRKTTKP